VSFIKQALGYNPASMPCFQFLWMANYLFNDARINGESQLLNQGQFLFCVFCEPKGRQS